MLGGDVRSRASPARARPSPSRCRPTPAPVETQPRSRCPNAGGGHGAGDRRRARHPRAAAAGTGAGAATASCTPRAVAKGSAWRGRSRPDAITLDIIMPELDGWTVLRELKADPELRDIPVVLVTILRRTGDGLYAGRGGLPDQANRHGSAAARSLDRYCTVGDGPRFWSSTTTPPRARCCGARWPRRDGRIVEAATAGTALRPSSDRRRPSCCLDLMMPGMDGFEVLEAMGATRRVARNPGHHHHRQGPRPRGSRLAQGTSRNAYSRKGHTTVPG